MSEGKQRLAQSNGQNRTGFIPSLSLSLSLTDDGKRAVFRNIAVLSSKRDNQTSYIQDGAEGNWHLFNKMYLYTIICSFDMYMS
jgi:hypothetical protein